ncbi:sulfatase-like hydrolase/transferase [Paenibacillus hamazuiensis]|uniref:sulfatase-like hydrolase/transferase n=1 Tax=Paenibacillus hamazuiensis TaxID=2936508 RepID=UPI00200F6100|nr:sulfatase-like hydrolase/transferase [Paenibacillus hamazuiensis]
MKMEPQVNLLVIVADQCRYDCIGYARKYPVRTPNLDRLASAGAWFTNAFTPIPVCCPARQAFIRGRRAETFGALWNFSGALKVSALSPEQYAWPKELSEAYRSCYIGKWGVNPEHDPMEYGFGEYIGEREYAEFRKQTGIPAPSANGYFGENDRISLEQSRTHWLSSQAVRRIHAFAKERKPWHLQVHFPEPHLPCRPSSPFSEMYSPADIPEWHNFKESFAGKPYIQKQQLYNWGIEGYTWQDWSEIVARYYAVISQMDDAVGHILQALEDANQAEHTIVVFTADHGDMCGAHRMMDKHYILYDDVVKVPLIVRWPGMVRNGTVCDRFVCNMLDLPPTLLEAAGRMPASADFHGRSLLPLLQGAPVPDWREEAVATYNGQQFGLYTQRMIRTNEWKYIWNTTDTDELYHLEDDPGELVNRIGDSSCRNVVAELRTRLYQTLLAEGDGLVQNEWMRDQLLRGRKL